MTGTNIAVPETVMVPGLGALVATSDLGQVAQALADIRELTAALGDARAVLTAAAARASAAQGTRTLHAAGYTVEVSADTELVWDVTVLPRLLAAGLPPERYAALVTETIEYKVDGRVARQLEQSNPEYAAILAEARVRQPKRQYATVKRTP